MISEAKKLGDKYLGEILLALSTLAITALAFFADEVLTKALVEWLGISAVGRIILGMSLVIVLLVAWVAYLHPRLKFDNKTGTLFVFGDETRYCHPCRVNLNKVRDIDFTLADFPRISREGWGLASRALVLATRIGKHLELLEGPDERPRARKPR